MSKPEDDLLPDPGEFIPLMAWRVAISEADGLLALVLRDDQGREATYFFPPAVGEELSERLAINAFKLREALGLSAGAIALGGSASD